MKKQTKWLLLIGMLCISFSLWLSPFIKVPDSIGDFFKGMGMVYVFTALVIEAKFRRRINRG